MNGDVSIVIQLCMKIIFPVVKLFMSFTNRPVKNYSQKLKEVGIEFHGLFLNSLCYY
jgi:hypothetical protein